MHEADRRRAPTPANDDRPTALGPHSGHRAADRDESSLFGHQWVETEVVDDATVFPSDDLDACLVPSPTDRRALRRDDVSTQGYDWVDTVVADDATVLPLHDLDACPAPTTPDRRSICHDDGPPLGWEWVDGGVAQGAAANPAAVPDAHLDQPRDG